jgi:hypothetical protein
VQNAEFSGFPLVVYDRLYSNGNGKITLQSYVTSFVVLPGIIQLGTMNRQISTIDYINSQHPDYKKQQEVELANLAAAMSSMTNMSISSVNVSNNKKQESIPIGEQPLSLTKKSESSSNLSEILNSNTNINISNNTTTTTIPQVPPGVQTSISQPVSFQLPTGIILPPNFNK